MKYTKEVQERIEKVKDIFPESYIYKEEELILEPKMNVYINLLNVDTKEFFDYKILSYCSFYTATHHFNPIIKVHKFFHNRLNRYFRRDFTLEDLQTIYQIIGTGCNKDLGLQFIKNDFDMELLKR